MKNKCLDCGKEVYRNSKRCRLCADKKHSKRMIGKNNPAFKGGLPYCIDCGKKLTSRKYKRCKKHNKVGKLSVWYGRKHTENTKQKIRLAVSGKNNKLFGKKRPEHSKNMTGKGNPNYIDGRSYIDYPSEWTKSVREFIIQRDKGKCLGDNCTITREEHLILYDRDIEVHHIDYNRKNCKENNLITLCKQCNIRANYNRQYWIIYFKNKIRNYIYYG